MKGGKVCNNNATSTIKITVQDTTNPTWDQVPTDQTVEYYTDFNYDVNASDLSGIASYTVNDTTNYAIDGSGDHSVFQVGDFVSDEVA